MRKGREAQPKISGLTAAIQVMAWSQSSSWVPATQEYPPQLDTGNLKASLLSACTATDYQTLWNDSDGASNSLVAYFVPTFAKSPSSAIPSSPTTQAAEEQGAAL